MTGAMPVAGAVPPCEDGPGSILPLFDHPATPIRGLLSPALACACDAAAAITLRLVEREGEECFDIAAVDAYGTMLLPLGCFSDADAVAEWRKLGASSGLPLMIARTDGGFDLPFPQLGRVQLGSIRIRRRHGLLNGRRPRFLTRRKTGRLPVRPAVHRERQLTAREI
jgi:Family of unknown function (DUF6101)